MKIIILLSVLVVSCKFGGGANNTEAPISSSSTGPTPTAQSIATTVRMNRSTNLTFSGSSIVGTITYWMLKSQPGNGVIEVSINGTFQTATTDTPYSTNTPTRYRPNRSYLGIDSFTYVVIDNLDNASSNTTANIQVLAKNSVTVLGTYDFFLDGSYLTGGVSQYGLTDGSSFKMDVTALEQISGVTKNASSELILEVGFQTIP